MLGRWSNFTPLELIVINEALNTAFEEGKNETLRWDEEAQKIAATIPAVAGHTADPINDYLNAEPDA